VSDNGYAVVTDRLTKRFGKKLALDGVSAHIPVGSVFGLMGPNGVGKTTFVRCLLNLINPTSGKMRVLGFDAERESVEVRRRTGHVAALQSLWEWMTVQEFVDFVASCFPHWNAASVSSFLERVAIDSKQKIGTLSRGQRTMAALGAAIGHEPQLLILDEALTGLDPISRRDVLESIIDVMHLEGRTVIITGQDIADLERICDHIGFLIKGKLFYEGPLEALKARVKRIMIQHPCGLPPVIPAGVLRVNASERETQFTVSNFTPELLDELAAPGRVVQAMEVSLENIFVDLVRPQLGRGEALPALHPEVEVTG
jgi:ABC-2 type transport system ATP-binding protein